MVYPRPRMEKEMVNIGPDDSTTVPNLLLLLTKPIKFKMQFQIKLLHSLPV